MHKKRAILLKDIKTIALLSRRKSKQNIFTILPA